MLIAIAAMITILLIVPRTSSICEVHKDLFLAQLRSGVVVKKFIDRGNHLIETVVINEGEKSFTLLLVPDVNDKDFEHIKVNDRITKDSSSFRFTINDEYEFEFQIECDFEH
jgi:hypothetical protein